MRYTLFAILTSSKTSCLDIDLSGGGCIGLLWTHFFYEGLIHVVKGIKLNFLLWNFTEPKDFIDGIMDKLISGTTCLEETKDCEF